jgi:hypothetical protein
MQGRLVLTLQISPALAYDLLEWVDDFRTVVDKVARQVELQFVVGIAPLREWDERIFQVRFLAAFHGPDEFEVPFPHVGNIRLRAGTRKRAVPSVPEVNITASLLSMLVGGVGLESHLPEGLCAGLGHEAAIEQGFNKSAQSARRGLVRIVIGDQVIGVLHTHLELLLQSERKRGGARLFHICSALSFDLASIVRRAPPRAR